MRCDPAATAARTDSDPEWAKVPSPMFWMKWSVPTNGSIPIQLLPSPPIWVMPMMLPTRAGSIIVTMPEQPIPAPTAEPSGTLVPVLCGQPEQKYGVRLGNSSIFFLIPIVGAGCGPFRRCGSMRVDRRRNSGSMR